jgi:hypothetical protein
MTFNRDAEVCILHSRWDQQRTNTIAHLQRFCMSNRCQYTGRVLHPNEGSLDHAPTVYARRCRDQSRFDALRALRG